MGTEEEKKWGQIILKFWLLEKNGFVQEIMTNHDRNIWEDLTSSVEFCESWSSFMNLVLNTVC